MAGFIAVMAAIFVALSLPGALAGEAESLRRIPSNLMLAAIGTLLTGTTNRWIRALAAAAVVVGVALAAYYVFAVPDARALDRALMTFIGVAGLLFLVALIVNRGRLPRR